MPRIQVLLKPDGTAVLEGHDFLGASCAEATAQFERALGLVSEREVKSEFYVQEDTVTQEMSQ